MALEERLDEGGTAVPRSAARFRVAGRGGRHRLDAPRRTHAGEALEVLVRVLGGARASSGTQDDPTFLKKASEEIALATVVQLMSLSFSAGRLPGAVRGLPVDVASAAAVQDSEPFRGR